LTKYHNQKNNISINFLVDPLGNLTVVSELESSQPVRIANEGYNKRKKDRKVGEPETIQKWRKDMKQEMVMTKGLIWKK
jgi:hypothetical protein